MRRLAGHGFLEYRLARERDGADEVVIEPQMPDYWPRLPALDDADVLVLSRFAYLRRRADDFVLELPRAGALFRNLRPRDRGRYREARLAAAGRGAAQRGAGRSATRFSPCSSTAASCSAIHADEQRCARRRETTTSSCGTFTISCSTRARPKAGMPIRSVGLIPMPP